MAHINIEATRTAARRIRDAGVDVAEGARAGSWQDAAAELQGSRTLGALEPFGTLLDRRVWDVHREMDVVGTAMHELAERSATATGEA